VKLKIMNKKEFYEIPDEEFVKLVKEFISDVGIEKMFKNANLTRDEEEKEDIINKNEGTD
jgi:hypothetical protein